MRFIVPVTLAQLKHMNTRTEKHGDEEVLACDLNIEFEATSESILKQLCLGDWEPLNFALFDKSTPERKVREPSLAPIKFTHSLKDHVLRLNTDLDPNGEFISNIVQLKRFRVDPVNGEVVKVFLQAQLTPDKKDLAVYAQGLEQGSVQIRIDPPAQLELIYDNKSKAAGAA
jgi:hypothetical protein